MRGGYCTWYDGSSRRWWLIDLLFDLSFRTKGMIFEEIDPQNRHGGLAARTGFMSVYRNFTGHRPEAPPTDGLCSLIYSRSHSVKQVIIFNTVEQNPDQFLESRRWYKSQMSKDAFNEPQNMNITVLYTYQTRPPLSLVWRLSGLYLNSWTCESQHLWLYNPWNVSKVWQTSRKPWMLLKMNWCLVLITLIEEKKNPPGGDFCGQIKHHHQQQH